MLDIFSIGRIPTLKLLFRIDNSLRQWITFFAMENGLHPKHRLTRYHDFFLSNLKKDETVLDIGCGEGYLAKDLAQKASHVIGIDINETSLKKAQENAPSNTTFIHGDATNYAFKEKFDVLVLSNVLEHIQNREDFLRNISPLANTILIRVPMLDRDWTIALKKELGIEYRLDPTHETEYTEKQFRQEIRTAVLQIESLHIRWGELYAVIRT